MSDKFNITGAEPKRIRITDTPKKRIEFADIVAGLGAQPILALGKTHADPISLAELGSRLMNQRVFVDDQQNSQTETVICQVHLSKEDARFLETFVAKMGHSTGVRPSVSQIAGEIVRLHVDTLKNSAQDAALAD